jgi:hypothetical protein
MKATISIIAFSLLLSSCGETKVESDFRLQKGILDATEKQNKILIEQNQIMRDRNSIALKHNEILEVIFKQKLDSVNYQPFNINP